MENMETCSAILSKPTVDLRGGKTLKEFIR